MLYISSAYPVRKKTQLFNEMVRSYNTSCAHFKHCERAFNLIPKSGTGCLLAIGHITDVGPEM